MAEGADAHLASSRSCQTDATRGAHILNSCGTPAEVPERDPAVSASFEGNRIVLLVRGEDAIRRLFPRVPDSVTFSRTRPDSSENDDDDGKESWFVAVDHSEP